DHLAASRSELLDDISEVFLGNVDRQLLIRLEALAVDSLAGDHARPRHLELEPLTAHGLHEDREVQLAATRDSPRICRVGILDTQRDVSLELMVQTIAHLTRRHVLSLSAGERRVVDDEIDGNRWLLDGDSLEAFLMLDVRERQTNLDALDAGQRDDFARDRLGDLDAIQSVERVQLRDP